jgi:Holliday junction resolvasome RuvABC endonuclease subunit
MHMPETIIAIDPSINFTGWCISQNGKKIRSGVIKTEKYKTDAEKLSMIGFHLKEIISDNALQPHNDLQPPITVAIIEIPEAFTYRRSAGRYGKQLNVDSLFKLSRAVGVILYICWKEEFKCIEVGATKWKGGMNKAVAMMVTGVKDNNEADAILLSEYYFRMKKLEKFMGK